MQEFRELAQPVLAIENAKAILLHLPQKRMINRGHDLGADHRTPVFAREEAAARREIFVRATRLKLHEPDESIVVDAGSQVFFGIVEPRHVFPGQINAAVGEIFRHVAQDVGDLEGEPKLDRIFAAGRILVTKNFNADEPDGARAPR